jgi:hypothetical protein
MPIDSLIVGLIVLLICGAAFFYLYMRISFYERKGSIMESVIVDLKMAIDSLLVNGQGGGGAPVPISPPPEVPEPPVELSGPIPLDSSESEAIPDENFYSSVLEQAHDETAPETQEAQPDLDTLTKSDLATLAENRGLRVKKSMNRNEILGLLRRSTPFQNTNPTAGAENVSESASTLDGGDVDLGKSGASLD